MQKAFLLAALAWLGPGLSPAGAADLSKIDRTIAREPAYRFQPQYCLLVFGSQARFRVWLVQDGDVLYVDRNGNGDLTEKGKRVAGLAVGDITEPGRGMIHKALSVRIQKDGSRVVSILTEGKHQQRSGQVTFAGRSQEAPIIHFNGPVRVRFTSAVTDTDHGKVEAPAAPPGSKERLLEQLDKGFSPPVARRQVKRVSLSAVMGTPGLGEGTWATYKAREILGGPKERIVVEAAFPNQDASARPIMVRGFLEPDG
jgi:hypothetical protein